jgi:hypothetical protein
VYPQTLYWFDPDDATAFAPGRFPVFIWRHGAGRTIISTDSRLWAQA